MIRYYCKVCKTYLDKRERDRNTNKCKLCKHKLDELEKQIGEKNDLELSKEITKERKKYDNNYVKIESKIYWCNNHNIPIYDEVCSLCAEDKQKFDVKYMSTDVRPVFYKERLLLAALIDDEEVIEGSVWHNANNKYVVNGKVIPHTKKDLMKKDSSIVRKHLLDLREKYEDFLKKDFRKNKYIQLFIKANEKHLNDIDADAIEFIKRVSKGYTDTQMFISFSGGKDSTVVHDLVLRALSGRKIFRFFGDTTLEFPDTYEYISRLKKDTRHLPMIKSENKKDDFYDLCKVIGPPSRVMRWCCTFFKTGPISNRLDRTFKNEKRILAFQGIRRSESISRSKYEKETDSPKIAKQKVVAPIIDWFDIDIWLYILSKEIDFNEAYEKGFSRVGCWCCPNNSEWAEYLSKVYMKEQSENWRDILMDFAIKTDKIAPDSYVDGGFWKARQGGNGLEISDNNAVTFKPCVNEEESFNYELKRPISDQLYELFKPFGYLNKEIGKKRIGEVYIVNEDDQPVLKLQGRKGSTNLKVTVINLELLKKRFGSRKIKNLHDAKFKIDCQITKYQICIGCSGCTSVCQFDAIKLSKNINNTSEINSERLIDETQYIIDDEKCIRCTKCVDHFDSGCYMKKVTRVKRSE